MFKWGEYISEKRRTELWRQVYLPSSRYDLQLDTTCCKVSDWRKKEHVDDWEMNHLQMFLRMLRVLFRYFIEKFNMFLGKFCWTVDQKLLAFWHVSLRMDEMTKPWDKTVLLMRSSWSCWIAVKTSLVLWNWSYWRLVP